MCATRGRRLKIAVLEATSVMIIIIIKLVTTMFSCLIVTILLVISYLT